MTAVAEQTGHWLAEFTGSRLRRGCRSCAKRLPALRASWAFPTTHDEEWRFTNVAPIARAQVRACGSAVPRIPPDVDRAESSQSHTSASYAAFRRPRLRRAEHRLPRGRDRTFTSRAARWSSEPIEIDVPLRPATAVYAPPHADRGGRRRALHHRRNLLRRRAPTSPTPSPKSWPATAPWSTTTRCSAKSPRRSTSPPCRRSWAAAPISPPTRISLGGALVRNDVNVDAVGRHRSHAERPLHRERHAARRQSHRPSTTPSRTAPATSCTKAFWTARSSAVFNGRIIVRKDAQKTDSKQTNKNLVLSDDAVINTKPELQIFADDVRCTHGATIGQLDAESLFYLQSRGIGKRMRAAC